jgi:monothiol glutaredoxin
MEVAMAGKRAVQHISAGALHDLIQARGKFELLDVRTDGERRNIPFFEARSLDSDLEEELARLPKETPLVFICYRGVRSLAAAQRFVALGFKSVYSLDGGVEAYVKLLGRPALPELALSA